MSHTEKQDVTYYNGHSIEVKGTRYVPWRSCRNLSYNSGFHCSACGYSLDYCLDGESCGLHAWEICYCPECGAEVVDE